MKYRRVILKLSGEVFGGRRGIGLDGKILRRVAKEISDVARQGVQIGLVIGGGNFFRGARNELAIIERTTGDDIGMLATVMNALAFRDFLKAEAVTARVMCALEMPKVAERFCARNADDYFSSGEVLIFAGGTGNPFFTTDSAAALRAAETSADLVLKATNVDGVYSADPDTNPKAKLFKKLSFKECVRRRLAVMDMTAFELCASNNIPVIVFNLGAKGSIARAISGEAVGTVISG